MKNIFIIVCCLLPLAASSQMKQRIEFSTSKNWQEVLDQSKRDKKLIFLDAVATWCSPCKKMDAEVYSNNEVANFVNTNFIPIKVQFDQTKDDSQTVKDWYTDAKRLIETYPIQGFPTYLFIDGNGLLIEKGVGYKSPEDFLLFLKRANDPTENYAGRIQLFKLGKLGGNKLLSLAREARELKDTTIAMQIAKQYKSEILDRESPSYLYTPQLRDFIVDFQGLFNLKDNLIRYMYHHQDEVNEKLKNKDFSMHFVDFLIRKEVVTSFLKSAEEHLQREPDWHILYSKIARSYDKETAERLVLDCKLDWFTDQKDWPNAVKYNIQKLESALLDTVGILARSAINSVAYSVIFQHSDDSIMLQKGINYMELILKHNPEMHTWRDTYANLLYKIGRKDEAIREEEAAIRIAATSKHPYNVDEYKRVLKKMQDNEPTWTEQQY